MSVGPASLQAPMTSVAEAIARMELIEATTPERDGLACFNRMYLDCSGWDFHPLRVDEVASSFFDDVSRFPPGTAALDSAFLMRGLDTSWRPLPRLRAGIRTRQPARP